MHIGNTSSYKNSINKVNWESKFTNLIQTVGNKKQLGYLNFSACLHPSAI